VWIAVGGSTASVARTAKLGLPLALAIIGGAAERFRPMVELYRSLAARAGHLSADLAVSINSHGFIADDSQQAAEIAFPPYAETMTRIGRERGWMPASRRQFEAERTIGGALFVGSPPQVIEKILYQHELFHHERFLIQLTVGPTPHAQVMRAIELLGTEVAPVVKRAVSGGGSAPRSAAV
jgi:alkanesulfonate monooxygenase SsuD/methylene tetrahydromethanopterin reductase-like flavin-dependent oxidoreductase (luciferase family)